MSGEISPLKRSSLRIFGGLAKSYDSVLAYATLMQDRRWKDWTVRRAGLTNGMKVLDIGCGTCVLEESIGPTCQIVGMDLSEEMLAVGRSKRLGNIGSLIHSDGERLPFRDESFDAVLSCYVVKYCDEGRLVSEAKRVLRPGGRLVLYDFVRPRGVLWPLNAMYAYGGLRVIGKILDLSHTQTAYTFSALPSIIMRRPWEASFGQTLRRQGFCAIEETLLPGGVAIGFRAEKGNS